MIVTILVFLLVLSVLVLIHEAGHFFTAKKLGIKVEEFGFGFPPRVFGKKYGETLYSLNLLPIGGFVKLYGEDEAGGGSLKVTDTEDKKLLQDRRSFISRNPWQRAAVVVAGVVMNFLLALVIISYLFAVQGVAIETGHIEIAQIAKNSPAANAGLVPGDIILSIDGKNMTNPSEVITYTKQHVGKQITVLIKTTKGVTQKITLTPRINYPASEGAMGIAIAPQIVMQKYPWWQAPFAGTVETLKQTWMILVGLKDMVVQLVVGRTIPQGVAGPVGIAQLTGQFIQVGPNAVLSLVSILSLNLAIMNILPIPALDGGRLFFILIEGITRKKVDPKFEGYAHTIGMLFLLTLIALITFHDIVRLVTHQALIQ